MPLDSLRLLVSTQLIYPIATFHTGASVLSQNCGTIIERDGNTNIVITSLNIARSCAETKFRINDLVDDLKVFILWFVFLLYEYYFVFFLFGVQCSLILFSWWLFMLLVVVGIVRNNFFGFFYNLAIVKFLR